MIGDVAAEVGPVFGGRPLLYLEDIEISIFRGYYIINNKIAPFLYLYTAIVNPMTTAATLSYVGHWHLA